MAARKAEVIYVGDAADLIRASRQAAAAAAKSAATVAKAAKTVAASSAASTAAIETSTAKTARRITSMASTVGGGLRALGRVAATTTKVAGVGLAVGLGYSLKSAMGFSKQLSSLGAVAGATGRQMNQLRKQALKAGADTAFSAREAAEAQTELAKGGLKAADILGGGLDAALGLAAAGELALGDAAAYTANAMNLFGINAKDSVSVADALATAANETTADVSEFGMALSQGGSAAKLAGASFTDTMVALEALAKAGIKGSDAGTSLKSFFLKIGNPSEKAKDAMAELNLELFDTQGNLKSLPAISDELRKSFGDLTKQQFLQKAGTIAGSDAIRTLYSLYDAGPKKLKAFEKGLSEQGTAQEVARKKLNNLAGDLEKLSGSAETAGIKLGSTLTPATRDMVQDVDKEINRLTPIANRALGNLVQVFRRDDLDFSGKLREGFKSLSSDLGPELSKVGQAIKGADLGKQFGRVIDFAIPKIMDAMAKAAPRAVETFGRAFMNAGAWGKVATLGFIAWKFGALRALGNAAAMKFAAGIVAGSGKIKLAFLAAATNPAGGFGSKLALAGATAGQTFASKMGAAIRGAGWVAVGFTVGTVIGNAIYKATHPKIMKLVGDVEQLGNAAVKIMSDRNNDNWTSAAKSIKEVIREASNLPAQKQMKLLVDNKAAQQVFQMSWRDIKRYEGSKPLLKILASNKSAVEKFDQLLHLAGEVQQKAKKGAVVLVKTEAARNRLTEVGSQIDKLQGNASTPTTFNLDTSQAVANINAVTEGVRRALQILQQYNNTPMAKKSPSARTSSATIPGSLTEANANVRNLERRFGREDIAAQRADITRRAHIGTPIKDISKSMRDGVREARKELRAFNAEQATARDRAQQTGKAMAWVRYFEKAKEQAQGLKDALSNVDSSLKGVFSSAVSEFESNWEDSVGRALDKANAAALKARDDANAAALDSFDAATATAIENGPAAKALKALEDEAARVAAEAEDKSNQQSLEDAKRSGDPRAIAAAQAAIVETARQREITKAQDAAEAERKQIEEQRAAERKAVEEQQAAERDALEESQQATREQRYADDVAAYQKALWDKLTAEQAMLNAGLASYADFASKVNAILHGNLTDANGNVLSTGFAPNAYGQGGVSFEVNAGDAAAIGKKKPKKPKKKGKAVGGGLDWGLMYRVGELGPEDIYMNRTGRPTVLTASESAGVAAGGGDINFNGPVTIGSVRAANAMMDRMAVRARRG